MQLLLLKGTPLIKSFVLSNRNARKSGLFLSLRRIKKNLHIETIIILAYWFVVRLPFILGRVQQFLNAATSQDCLNISPFMLT